MRIAYVDDSAVDREESLPLFQKGFEENDIAVEKLDLFSSSNEFFESWKPNRYDLLLLDIIMDGMTGIELAKRLRTRDENVWIVFCSTSNDFASESYRVNACYYLKKPLSPEEVDGMCRILRGKLREEEKHITLPDGKRILPRKIVYASYYNHLIEIIMTNGTTLKTRLSFSGFLELLQEFNCFCACDSGTCINMYEVERQEKNIFLMKNGDVIQISRRRKKEVLDLYHDFLFRLIKEGK